MQMSSSITRKCVAFRTLRPLVEKTEYLHKYSFLLPLHNRSRSSFLLRRSPTTFPFDHLVIAMTLPAIVTVAARYLYHGKSRY